MKKVLVSLLSIALIGCSQPILNNTSQYSDLDKEYSQFTTKALTQSYLKKKMDKWLSDGKYSKNLVREIEYAKFKHKDLLKDIVALQPTMFDNITANTGVNQKRVESPFENYIQYINPYPSAVTANNATNVTTSSFTAHWTSNTKASSYKLFVNGSEVYSGANTSFDVTNLSFGTTPTYYVKAVNSAGTSPNSNTISVTLNPDTVTALDATDLTQTSFTANWSPLTGATSYKLKVDNGEFTDVGNITSKSIIGLTIGSSHTYSVQAVNSGGTGSSSNNISVTLLPSAPVATDGTNITTSSFTANWGTVTGATSYKLFVNGSEVYSGASTSCNVTNLSFGTTPTYYVKAVNSAGTSPNSNTISVTLNPDTVTALDATSVTQTSFTANWNSVSGATSYKLKVDAGAFTDVGAVTSKSITGLTIGTTHTYSVQAVNSGGTGSSSNIITVNLNPAVPAIPTTLVATNIGQTSFTANWNSVSGATSYKLKIDSGAYVDVGAVTSFDVTGLTIGTVTTGSSHNYYVQASNISGTSAGSTARAVTLLPATPSAPIANIASSVTSTSFRANWSSVSGATGYKLYIDGSLAYTGTNLYYDKSSLTSGSSHTYYVQAYNTGGTSPNSNTISVSIITHLTSIQSLSTDRYTYDWEAFTIGANQYIAVANHWNGTSTTIDSNIYKWNSTTSQFESFQSITSYGAYNWKFFTIGTDSYISLTNYYSNSVIYKWNGSQFAEIQSIPTSQAVSSDYFSIGSNYYLAFSNINNYTSIYKWNGSQFVSIQQIGIASMNYRTKAFAIGTDNYIAICNYYEGTTEIYKWNTLTNLFDVTPIQTISLSLPTRGSEIITIGSDNYIAISIDSSNTKIFKWNTSTNKFNTTAIQTITSSMIFAPKSFSLGSDTYLAIPNNGSNSEIYKWNGTTFVLWQTVATNYSNDWAYFMIGTTHYLAVAGDYSESKVYRLD